MGTFRELTAYRKAFSLSMEIFELTKNFPKEETYSLIDQIRRSSRSVFSSIAEAYKKRRYPNHFISKLTDSDMENGETQAWLDASLACCYISREQYDDLNKKSEEVSYLLIYMINNPEKFK
ncbi:four helix bundle protein [Mucilaginibacter myungsuensis]|uniref:Four helix bundle protein n=1 Tax=Mucilaginibacter myungsuensis TaxID=649104 RepID=A0A929KZA7_9SPHI|nr:four helix bundle protein [Mucilaginibacter myungsuensis]MBE9663310.1 four helix bundle protein [Mucilaginibacter myungsuensis]MDN3600045.1 four helix bundle protein [Mucilaginibacter myungsuensis]